MKFIARIANLLLLLAPYLAEAHGFDKLPTRIENSWNFILIGMSHIFSGIDHILFIVSLLLVYVSFRELLKLTGTFTLAHSITLPIVYFNFALLSPKIVEPLIAFSIAAVALDSLRNPDDKTNWKKNFIVFLFGLIHGMGFAGFLKEVSIPKQYFLSSLVFFNVGIELGQIVIASFIFSLKRLLSNKAWYPKFIRYTAITLVFVGVGWTLQRILS